MSDRDCPHCRDWGKEERHQDHWPPRPTISPADPGEAGSE